MHTGSHKLNNALGQCLLAKRMGKPRIIAETGAGQHGVATATACALLGLECVVYMGTEDMRRQMPNVQRMRLLGATVAGVDAGLAHAQGGGLRRDPRLGRQRRGHALRDRLVRRPGAVPRARARPAADHRRRGARADPRAQRAPARARDRLRRRRLQRDRHLHPVRRRRRGGARRRRGGGRGARHRPPRRAAHRRRPRRRAARLLLGDHAGRGGPDHRGALDLGRPRLSRLRPGARVAARLGPRPLRRGHRRPGASTRSAASPRSRGSSRRSSPPTRSPGCSPSRRGGDDALDLVCLSGRGDKDLAEVLERSSRSTRSPPGAATTIAAAFAAAGKRAALMPYLMGGFPTLDGVARHRRGLRRGRRGPRSSSASRSPTRSPTAR